MQTKNLFSELQVKVLPVSFLLGSNDLSEQLASLIIKSIRICFMSQEANCVDILFIRTLKNLDLANRSIRIQLQFHIDAVSGAYDR